jgi:hypothetical protein
LQGLEDYVDLVKTVLTDIYGDSVVKSPRLLNDLVKTRKQGKTYIDNKEIVKAARKQK